MDDWQDLIAQIGESARALIVGQFIVVDYATSHRLSPEPYAQATHAGPDLICELVSGEYLPASQWPLDEVALRRAGWAAPSQGTENWWRLVEAADLVAAALVDGLRMGRACLDPEAFSWTVGTFPPSPGDGEPVPIPAPYPGDLARAA
jgi:hypothetical protein